MGVGTVRILEEDDEEESGFADVPAFGGGAEAEAIDVSSGEEEEVGGRRKRKRGEDLEEDDGGDKKKLGLRTGYEGFSIYKSILCLIVKRTGKAAGDAGAGGSAMLESWVSTQMDKEGIINDEDG